MSFYFSEYLASSEILVKEEIDLDSENNEEAGPSAIAVYDENETDKTAGITIVYYCICTYYDFLCFCPNEIKMVLVSHPCGYMVTEGH